MSEEIKRPVQIEILTIGNEILTGLIADTNARMIAEKVMAVGAEVRRVSAVRDDKSEIIDALTACLTRVDWVIVSGGLGPTHDDITVDAVADYFSLALTHDSSVEGRIRDRFKQRGLETPEISLKQCLVPSGARVLDNELGTAPGLLVSKNSKNVFCVPGVPYEMEHLLDESILGVLKEQKGPCVEHRLVKTTGIAESLLWEKIGTIKNIPDELSVASLPSLLGVKIRLSCVSQDKKERLRILDDYEKILFSKVSEYIYAVGEKSLEEELGRILLERGLSITVAESCTGGLIAHRLTHVPGSSAYFLEGVVCYSNESKVSRLGVEPGLIERIGAVSSGVACQMAEGVRKNRGADLGLSVTGIAGPDGGSDSKPVGLTYIAIADKWGVDCQEFHFHQNRHRNRERAAQAALNLARLRLLSREST